MSRRKDYDVGYGKPPVNTRFKKGQSGNPAGRPKGSRNLLVVLEETLNEQVRIKENGQWRQLSKLELLVKQLVNKAATGDSAATQRVVQLAMALDGKKFQESMSMAFDSEADQQVLQNIKKRLASQKEKQNA